MIGFFSIGRKDSRADVIQALCSWNNQNWTRWVTVQLFSYQLCMYMKKKNQESCDMSIDVLDRKTHLCMFSIAIGLLIFGFSSSTVSSRWCCVLPVRCHQTLQKKRAERGRELQMPGGPVCCSFSPITEFMFVLWTDYLKVLYQSTLALCYLGLLPPQQHAFFCRVEGGSCSYLFPHFVLCS